MTAADPERAAMRETTATAASANPGTSLGAEPAEVIEEPSTRRALAFVYVGYAFRYLYLAILVPFYARVLGASEYGRLLTAMGVFQIVWMITEYGFPSAGVRDAARSQTPEKTASLYSRHTAGRLVMLLPALAVGVGATMLSPLLRERPIFGVLATLTGIVAGFNLGWFFQGRLEFRTSVLLEILGFAVSVALILSLVRGPDQGAYVFVALLTSSVICTGLAHVIAMTRMRGGKVRVAGGFGIVRESTALFIHRGLGMIVASSSTYLISLYASPAEVGWYGAAERIASVGLALLQPANQVLIGTVSRRLGAPDREESGFTLMRQGLIALTGVGVLMLVGSLVLSPIVLPLVLGPEFAASIPILLVLSLMFPFAAFAQVVNGYVLIPLRLDWTVSRVGMVSAGLTLAAVLVLGKLFEGAGVAWARVLGSVFTAVILLQVLRQKGLIEKLLGDRPLGMLLRVRGGGT